MQKGSDPKPRGQPESGVTSGRLHGRLTRAPGIKTAKTWTGSGVPMPGRLPQAAGMEEGPAGLTKVRQVVACCGETAATLARMFASSRATAARCLGPQRRS